MQRSSHGKEEPYDRTVSQQSCRRHEGLQGTAGFVVYCTSKGAVRLMTNALADEFGPRGIRVNALHPGPIETTMTTKDVPIIGSERHRGSCALPLLGSQGGSAG